MNIAKTAIYCICHLIEWVVGLILCPFKWVLSLICAPIKCGLRIICCPFKCVAAIACKPFKWAIKASGLSIGSTTEQLKAQDWAWICLLTSTSFFGMFRDDLPFTSAYTAVYLIDPLGVAIFRTGKTVIQLLRSNLMTTP